jgi:hypothetical protein
MLIAVFGCVLVGMPASPASARVTAPDQAPLAVAPGSHVSVPPMHRVGPGLPRIGRHPGELADLVVTVRIFPRSRALRWVLTCRPDGGSLPFAGRACGQISRTWDPFAPVPRGHELCSMIAFGPQTATVTGFWRGTWISARFSRNNGCEAARWDRVSWMLVVPVAGDPGGPINPGGPMVSGAPSAGGSPQAG